ncbi:MAG: hypothetical protein JW860_10860 [Sedimentisphaerales bacterium]|nr:hypothetical protein [Sedimentisphaerales bacterium]
MKMDNVLKQWARLGAAFNVTPAKQTPDIERLLIETARALPQFARLLPISVTWLTIYYRLVCRHRLAGFASKKSNRDATAILGLMLSTVKQITESDHFNLVIKICKPADKPGPLFEIDKRSNKLKTLARKNSCASGRQWGLWHEAIEIKHDAIKPFAWVLNRNPSLKQRALFNGNLRASILETLSSEPQAGQSESALARTCYATRKAIREALDQLEFCQMIHREYCAGKIRITI